MKNILIGLFSREFNDEGLINKFDDKGWEVHLFNVDEDDIDLHVNQDIDAVFEFLNNNYFGVINLFIISDVYQYTVYLQEQMYESVSGIIWYIDKGSNLLHKNQSKPIYLITSALENALFQITEASQGYLYFSFENPMSKHRYFDMLCNDLLDEYKCELIDIQSLLSLNHKFLKNGDYNAIYSVLDKVIVSNDGMRLIQDYLASFCKQIQVTILMYLFEKTKCINYIKYCISVISQLSIKEAYGLMWTIKSMIFVGKLEFDKDARELFNEAYRATLNRVKQTIDSNRLINCRPKNKKVVLLISQFLGILHAPTRNVLDYAFTLINMGYEAIIINTGEMVRNNALPIRNAFRANFNNNLNELEMIKYNGVDIGFLQNQYDMPNATAISMLLNYITGINPEFVINVGDFSITADLCAEYYKTVHIPCGSGIPQQINGYFAIPRMYDSQYVKDVKNDYFNIRYSFLMKQKEHNYTRRELELPEDAFIVTIVGNRLGEEVREDFLRLLEKLSKAHESIYYVFLGNGLDYQAVINAYPFLKEKSKYLGFMKDIMAVYAICDLYLNPKRNGGATSAAECMMEGIPVITPSYGDVYYQLWMKNGYNTDSEVLEEVNKLVTDTEYYKEQSKAARSHIEDNFNTQKMMQSVIDFLQSQDI